MQEGLERAVIVSFVLVVLVGFPGVLAGDDRGEGERSWQGAPDALRAYVDPETGEFTAPPERAGGGAGMASPPGEPSDLEVVPAPTSAGGLMVDLSGQFSYATRAHASPDGTVREECARQPDSAARR